MEFSTFKKLRSKIIILFIFQKPPHGHDIRVTHTLQQFNFIPKFLFIRFILKRCFSNCFDRSFLPSNKIPNFRNRSKMTFPTELYKFILLFNVLNRFKISIVFVIFDSSIFSWSSKQFVFFFRRFDLFLFFFFLAKVDPLLMMFQICLRLLIDHLILDVFITF